MRPQPGRAEKQAMPAKSPRSHRKTRHSPRNGFTVYFALSPVTGLSCHRRLAKVAFRKLDTSVGVSGPHDFAVRLRRIRQSAIRVHRIP
ncbi:hypothetical protein, partial [Bradyrhizobium sp.]|uniref:hypothetical protein n=1 Tax=Bradyrhizobium sp. TaxID=376 RepID=UPI0025BBA015